MPVAGLRDRRGPGTARARDGAARDGAAREPWAAPGTLRNAVHMKDLH
jgi:hypothetical protein